LKGSKPSKFGDQYTGPYEILEILNRNNIKIRIKKNSRIVPTACEFLTLTQLAIIKQAIKQVKSTFQIMDRCIKGITAMFVLMMWT